MFKQVFWKEEYDILFIYSEVSQKAKIGLQYLLRINKIKSNIH